MIRKLLLIVVLCGWTDPVAGQVPVVEAATGQPMSVARVTIPLDSEQRQRAWQTRAIHVTSDATRLFYPVYQESNGVAGVIAALTGQDTRGPARGTIYFLFEGAAPLNIQLPAWSDTKLRLAPLDRPAVHQRLYRQWWQEQLRELQRVSSGKDDAQMVASYLSSVHARRWNLPLGPILTQRVQTNTESVPAKTRDLLLGRNAVRQKAFWQAAYGTADNETADQPLPPSIPLHEPVAEGPQNVAVEPIAFHVPDDCFYIRFGKYSNLLWYTKMMEQRSAEIGRLVTLRSREANYSKRIEQQLCIKELPFAEYLGDKVIADVAFIGRDFFFQDGASVGILLEENTGIVESGLRKTRDDSQKKFAATGQILKIDGTEVSFLSTPDNRIRSYYARRDRWHLTTNSRQMIEQFVQIDDDGRGSLARTAAFREARQDMPYTADYTVFGYLPANFFVQLLRPGYQIEARRRVRAAAELNLLELARLGWQFENVDHPLAAESGEQGAPPLIAELIVAGWLPANFGQRPDASHAMWSQDGHSVDSLRGARGVFLPVADATIDGASPRERHDYEALAAYHANNWSHFDPLYFGIRKRKPEQSDPADGGLEILDFDLRIAPTNQRTYQLLSKWLGEPTTARLAANDEQFAIVATGHLSGGLIPGTGRHQILFAALDRTPSPEPPIGGLLGTMDLIRSAPAILASRPALELFVSRLLGRLRKPDQEGYVVGPLGLWRRYWEDSYALSYQRNVLQELTPALHMKEDDLPAQLRLNVGDLAQTKLAGWLKALAADRGLRGSISNVRFLNTLSRLGVPHNQAIVMAERLWGNRPLCPLGGEFEHHDGDDFAGWVSSAWAPQGSLRIADGERFEPALLKWFHGLKVKVLAEPYVVQGTGQLTLYAAKSPDGKGAGQSLFFGLLPHEND